MAVINSTRQFFNEIETICSAFEAMQTFVAGESERIELAQAPILSRFRDLLDQGDSIIPSER